MPNDSDDEWLQIHSVAREDVFDTDLTATKVSVKFSMKLSYEASMDFTWCGRTYTFNVTAWKSGGIDKFVKLFHQHAVRDTALFGSITVGVDGLPLISMDSVQKGNAVLQGCRDVMLCLGQILGPCQSSIMDYAMWYRENHKEDMDYSSYITLRTCHCIVHSELLSPTYVRPLIKFSDA